MGNLNSVTKTLGEVIAQQREKLGITQRELADKVHINNSTISRIEKNPDICADPKTLKAIANELHLDYNYLLALNHTIADDSDIRMIARATKNMTPQRKSEMIDMLKREFAAEFSGADSDEINPISSEDNF